MKYGFSLVSSSDFGAEVEVEGTSFVSDSGVSLPVLKMKSVFSGVMSEASGGGVVFRIFIFSLLPGIVVVNGLALLTSRGGIVAIGSAVLTSRGGIVAIESALLTSWGGTVAEGSGVYTSGGGVVFRIFIFNLPVVVINAESVSVVDVTGLTGVAEDKSATGEAEENAGAGSLTGLTGVAEDKSATGEAEEKAGAGSLTGLTGVAEDKSATGEAEEKAGAGSLT